MLHHILIEVNFLHGLQQLRYESNLKIIRPTSNVTSFLCEFILLSSHIIAVFAHRMLYNKVYNITHNHPHTSKNDHNIFSVMSRGFSSFEVTDFPVGPLVVM